MQFTFKRLINEGCLFFCFIAVFGAVSLKGSFQGLSYNHLKTCEL